MSDEKIPGPVRSHAGDYLEVELQEKLMGPSPAAFAGERGGVRVYNHDTFRDQFLKTLVAEKGDECVVDGRVANAVWRLSRGEAVEQEEAAAPKDGTPGSPIATWQGRAGRAR